MAVTRISAEEANRRMTGGERIAFVDSRNDQAWAAADTKLPDAIRVPAGDVEKHLADIPRDRTVVSYCT